MLQSFVKMRESGLAVRIIKSIASFSMVGTIVIYVEPSFPLHMVFILEPFFIAYWHDRDHGDPARIKLPTRTCCEPDYILGTFIVHFHNVNLRIYWSISISTSCLLSQSLTGQVHRIYHILVIDGQDFACKYSRQLRLDIYRQTFHIDITHRCQ